MDWSVISQLYGELRSTADDERNSMLGAAPAEIAATLKGLRPPPGRTCEIAGPKSRQCFIDTAHNAEAIGAALANVRKRAKRRIICVLGAGGGRDQSKRQAMAQAAAADADVVIVTDDNPRSEEPADIRSDLLCAATNALETDGRQNGIALGLSLLEEHDTLAILGMGHDTWIDDMGEVNSDRACVLAHEDWVQVSEHWPPARKRATLAAEMVSS